MEVELELGSWGAAAATSPPSTAVASSGLGRPRADSPGARSRRGGEEPPGTPPTALPGLESSVDGSSGSPADTPGPPGGYGPPPVVGVMPGAGGPAIWSMPGVMAPDRPPPAPTTIPRRSYDRDAAGKILRSELQQRDARLGILPPVAAATASALRVAVRAHTPAVSRGSFQARFSAGGRLVGLQVLSFDTGSIQQWQRAVDQARGELVSQIFAMAGHFTGGARVTVHTRSVMQYPSGSGRKPVKKRPQGPPKWPFLPPEPPPEGRSFRTPPWGPPPEDALARGDASDIGARPHRVVYATVDAQPL